MANTKLTEKLTAVADAIREKTGKSEKMTLAEMPVEIGNIQSGGGSAARDYEVDDVTFYDFDGTIVYSCSMEEAQKLEKLPTPPEHKGLVFQEWNWTLEQIKSSSVGADVGALYDTEDGAIVYVLDIQTEYEKTIGIKILNSSDNNTFWPSVEWGDGQVYNSESEVYDNKVLLEHTYDRTGVYKLKIHKGAPGTCHLRLGNYGQQFLAANAESPVRNVLKAVYVGSDCAEIDQSIFYNAHSVQALTFHSKLTIPNSKLLGQYLGVKCFVFPPTQTNAYNTFMDSAVEIVSIPPTILIYSGANSGCKNIRRVIIPDSVAVLEKMKDMTYCGEMRIGNGLKKIGSYAFSGNSLPSNTVRKITFPASLTTLETSCLAGMDRVQEYHFKCQNPPALASSGSIRINTFNDVKTKIYVPKGTADAYKSATNWAALADYIIEEA